MLAEKPFVKSNTTGSVCPSAGFTLTVTVKSLVCAWLVSPQVQALVAVTVKNVYSLPCVIVTVPSSLITKVPFAVSSVEVLVAV